MIKQFFILKILGHFGKEYPWHTKTIEELTARLKILSEPLDKQARISLRIGFILTKFFDNKKSLIIGNINPLKSRFGKISSTTDFKSY